MPRALFVAGAGFDPKDSNSRRWTLRLWRPPSCHQAGDDRNAATVSRLRPSGHEPYERTLDTAAFQHSMMDNGFTEWVHLSTSAAQYQSVSGRWTSVWCQAPWQQCGIAHREPATLRVGSEIECQAIFGSSRDTSRGGTHPDTTGPFVDGRQTDAACLPQPATFGDLHSASAMSARIPRN